ncbi:MAG: class III extradiol ring-cleavage dioxygenase [Desulfoprunum sp.]|uniref:DODA-type extradiol aromatic ring-opening family dioxygenase n=1 Tax=Desulfoprunum sp. TaxID=2020866 RepID=UPI00052CF231|nr:extradiol ring-cleavage dioxygenase [Desulfobulbus sp. Tol-SR]
MTEQPALFVSHGAPNLILKNDANCRFFRDLGRTLARPAAIVCVSAHWDTDEPLTSGADLPPTIHDFSGFEAELYSMRYPCPGDPALAARIADSLSAAEIPCFVSEHRGIDHGAWVPLKLMFPSADIPVVQVSIQTDRDTRRHYDLGRVLAPLRRENVLIVGSGGATHNLREFGRYAVDAPPVGYAAAFDEWLAERIEDNAIADLLAYRDLGPEARRNHPGEDHILPLFAPLGAAAGQDWGRRIHHRIEYGILSMAAFAWGL